MTEEGRGCGGEGEESKVPSTVSLSHPKICVLELVHIQMQFKTCETIETNAILDMRKIQNG
jgi:hypothetical protein